MRNGPCQELERLVRVLAFYLQQRLPLTSRQAEAVPVAPPDASLRSMPLMPRREIEILSGFL